MDRARVREIAQSFVDKGDIMGMFEALYAEAADSPADIPWADMRPNPQLIAWLESPDRQRTGPRALVVGCGLGDDAEYLSAAGFDVTAFDIAPTAVALCQGRFPQSRVTYVVADLLNLPAGLTGQFDLVVEIYTVQAMKRRFRSAALRGLASTLAPGGLLLIIARGREEHEDPGHMPWPLTKTELDEFKALGLHEASFEVYFDDETPPVRRFRATYRKP